jgi:hypothetical protein
MAQTPDMKANPIHQQALERRLAARVGLSSSASTLDCVEQKDQDHVVLTPTRGRSRTGVCRTACYSTLADCPGRAVRLMVRTSRRPNYQFDISRAGYQPLGGDS